VDLIVAATRTALLEGPVREQASEKEDPDEIAAAVA
jgi:hypothetical protein